MVLLTVVAPSNNHTIYFRHPLPKPNYIRLFPVHFTTPGII